MWDGVKIYTAGNELYSYKQYGNGDIARHWAEMNGWSLKQDVEYYGWKGRKIRVEYFWCDADGFLVCKGQELKITSSHDRFNELVMSKLEDKDLEETWAKCVCDLEGAFWHIEESDADGRPSETIFSDVAAVLTASLRTKVIAAIGALESVIPDEM